jgi:hypothetical protein
MAQATLQNIDPATTDGTELAGMLEGVGAAIRSTNLGATRPSYAQAGTIWVQQTTASLLTIFIFDGSEDIPLGTVNTATNLFTAANLAPAVTLASLGGVAITRQVATTNSLTGGGDLSADRTVQLVNDVPTPGASRYYGTNSGGTKGFHALPVLNKAQPRWGCYQTIGNTSFVVPAGVTQVFVCLYGASGGGRTGSYDTGGAEGGWTLFQHPGGRGGRLRGTYPTVPGQTLTITVGGNPGVLTSDDIALWSQDGGYSSFGNMIAYGGQGTNLFNNGGARGTHSAGSSTGASVSGPDIEQLGGIFGNYPHQGLVEVYWWE